MPTYTVVPSAIVDLPLLVQVPPSYPRDALTVVPVRTNFTQRGAVPVALMTDVVRAPAWVRYSKPTPRPAVTSTRPCAASALSELRIITPAFDHTSAPVSDSIRATI